MSADLLRRAAADLRETSPTGTYADPCGECGQTGALVDALADMLADMAAYLEWVDENHPGSEADHAAPAVAVARAVLGEPA